MICLLKQQQQHTNVFLDEYIFFYLIRVHESTKELAYIIAIRSKLYFFFISLLSTPFFVFVFIAVNVSHTHTHGCNKYVRNLHIFARRSFSLRLLLSAFHYSILSSSRQVWRASPFSVTSSRKKTASIEYVSDLRHNRFQRNFSSLKYKRKQLSTEIDSII